MDYIDRLIHDLASLDAMRQKNANEELTRIGEPAFLRLIEKLGDSDASIRCEAAKVLGEIGDARAVGPLIDRLVDESMGALGYGDEDFGSAVVLRYTIEALGKMKDVKAVPALIDVLDTWKNLNMLVGGWAAWALGEMKDARAVESLVAALKDKEPLIRALDDEYDGVPPRAFKALIKIGDPSVAPMIKMLRHKEEGYRVLAAKALVKLAPEADIDLSKVSESLERHADRVKRSNDREKIERARKEVLETYIQIADAVAKRKKAQMPGVLSKGKIKPPKKRMYRMRKSFS